MWLAGKEGVGMDCHSNPIGDYRLHSTFNWTVEFSRMSSFTSLQHFNNSCLEQLNCYQSKFSLFRYLSVWGVKLCDRVGRLGVFYFWGYGSTKGDTSAIRMVRCDRYLKFSWYISLMTCWVVMNGILAEFWKQCVSGGSYAYYGSVPLKLFIVITIRVNFTWFICIYITYGKE